MWRMSSVYRGLTIGLCGGLFFGGLAWLDSGLLAAAIVFVVLGLSAGVWVPRRMTKYWPGSNDLTGDQRVAVARAVRDGTASGDSALQQPVLDYSSGLHAAAEKNTRFLRWVLIFVLVVAIVTAVWDAVSGSWGSAVASAVYLVLAVLEVFWWPRWLKRLLDNADRAAALARQPSDSD
jgi:hypothetical protein